MYQMDTLFKESLKEFFLDVSPVCKYLPEEFLGEDTPYSLIPVVYVRPCKTECDDFSTVVAQQVQLEAMTPAHGTLSVLGKAGKDLIVISSYIVTYGYHCAVNIGDSRTMSESKELHEQHQLAEHSWHEFNEAVIGNRVGKILTHHPFDPIQIILLEIAVCAEMIAYQNGHNLTF